ncbi:MAG: PD-(D/E)XK nuclease family protein [Bacilli bacterium]|nr:PD-(D/E)XK nuclease family protein [Bacilli bacterium]
MIFKNNSIYIVPNNLKKKILLELSKENEIKNIKFFSLKEFIDNLTFKYDEKSIYYLMKNYNYKYKNAIVILDNLKYVENKEYNVEKLDNLVKIKNELSDYLIYNDYFKEYVKDKQIYIMGYSFIDKFDLNLIKDLNYKIIDESNNNYEHNIYEFENIFDEVIYVSSKIRELINKGININKIKIIDLPSEYSFILKEVFNMFNLNINTYDDNIYGTIIVKEFFNIYDNNLDIDLLKEKFDMNNQNNLYIFNKIIEVLNKYNFDIDKDIKREILINEFKKIKNNKNKYKNEIEIISINDTKDDEYNFILGFNEGNFPKLTKDEDYLSDKLKEKLKKSLTYEKNSIIRKDLINKIKNIKNLEITYKMKTPFNEYFKSSLIDDMNYEVKKINNIVYNYSDNFNKLKLSIDLDNLVKYQEKSKDLEYLYSNYKDIDFMTYDNKFKGIDKEKLHKFLNNKLTLSYSTIDEFYKCKFRYYLNNVLRLDSSKTTFEMFVGNLFHYILSICFLDNFDFEKEYNEYLKKYDLNNKEKFYINKLKKDLLFIINVIKKQNSYSKLKEAKYENRFSIDKSTTLKVSFIGYIDKLMYKEENGKKLLVIVDYKTGDPILKLNNCYYGLNLQLPVYLYLSKNNEIKDSKVIGFYLQKMLNNLVNIDKKKTVEDQKEENLRLQGYSIYDEDLLKEFDSNYENSRVVRSLSKTQNGFSSYSKLLTENQMNALYDLVDKKINEARDSIINADFEINPKRISDKNMSCNFCKFKDICFMNENNIVNLKEIKDLDFLGGDNNA